jgi:hypothetical protein
MIETEKAWLAGIFDGEGCVWCRWPKRTNVIVEIKMADFRTANRINTLFPGRLSEGNLTLNGWSRKTQWRWSLDTNGTRSFLTKISLYLVTKREHANIALLLCQRPAHPHRDRLAEQLRQLNA